MQGKVTLEDHFAIEATLGNSQPFGAMSGRSCGIVCSTFRTSGCA